MYKGYLTFDGVPIINVAATMAYIRAGVATPDIEFDTPVAFDGLAEALGESYRTPVLDAAPWYDQNRPETHGFAGVLPLDITGLYGTTAAREVVENVDDGGVAQMVRRATRTLAVSALLVGDSSASTQAGLEWLTTVLLRECTEPVYSARLEGFSVLPDGATGAEDLDSPLVPEVQDPTAPGWRSYGGTWHPTTETFTVVAPRVPVPVLDGGEAGTVDFDTTTDGGSAAPDSPDGYADGGDPAGPAGLPYARLVGPGELTCLSEVTVEWTVTGLTEGAVVQVGAVDSQGEELYRDPMLRTIAAGAPTVITWTRVHPAWESWWPALWVSDPGVEVQLTVSRRPYLDPEACLAPLRRTYADLATIAGPTVVGDYADDCGNTLLQVEWTWSVGNPFRYGDPVSLVTGLPSNAIPPVSSAPGVVPSYLGTVTSAATACTAPSTLPATCAYDPALPGFVAPPAAPVISDGSVMPTNFRRSLLAIDPGVFPATSSVALSWQFENDATAKHNVRVRLWRQSDPDFTTHTECDFETEFWITYIDADAVFTIDGALGDIVALCDGAPVPAAGVMRGPYRGAFTAPVVACGGRYFVTVDTASTEGALDWSLSYSPREG